MSTQSSERLFTSNMSTPCTRRRVILGAVVVVAVFVVGLLVGRFAITGEGEAALKLVEAETSVEIQLLHEVNSENIRENLRQLTAKPHLAGTQADYDQAKELAVLWKNLNFDDVKITPYDVMLSYPDPNKPNFVRLLGENDALLYQSPEREAILTPRENVSGVVPPFNAYSAPGTVRGELVYVNYGREEDFEFITGTANVSVTGRIAIVKYGKIFRGDKVKAAEKYGAIGLIIYSDPGDYARGDSVYPHSKWLPPTGAQRGSIYVTDGDPQTPGYPSTDTAYRIPEADIASLPRIPVHPISYGEAEQLMKYMSGEEVPAAWNGTMNIQYRYGPGFTNDTVRQVEMDISTRNERRKIYNTIGTIRGAVEPDRYVILGNHRDAWVFGAMDPSSGTAVMMEVARVVSSLVQSGNWRPRRTLIFCSWAAEEYGLIGSNEWVQEYVKNLGGRTVAYLNVDTSVSGNHSVFFGSTPLLYRAIYEAAKQVPDIRTDKSVYDRWLETNPWTEAGLDEHVPLITRPGSGSDHAPFLQKAGVPSLEFGYRDSQSSYPLYHSVYETFYAMEQFFDPDFKAHACITSLWLTLARNLADAIILPYNVSDYGVMLEKSRQELDLTHGFVLRSRIANYSALEDVIKTFKIEADNFMDKIATVDKNDALSLRRTNDQLMQLERAFVDPNGLPGRPYFGHLFLAPSKLNIYEGSSFPGIEDLILEPTEDEAGKWERVKHHFSVLLYTIQSAASTLKDVGKFVQGL